MMSWFHLTLGGQLNVATPIVDALNCGATTPGERLIRLGQRVGIQAHPRTREFLVLANGMSLLLRLIEAGALSSPATVPLLYSAASPLASFVDEIVTSWSLVTGRDIKATAIRLSAGAAVSTACSGERPRARSGWRGAAQLGARPTPRQPPPERYPEEVMTLGCSIDRTGSISRLSSSRRSSPSCPGLGLRQSVRS